MLLRLVCLCEHLEDMGSIIIWIAEMWLQLTWQQKLTENTHGNRNFTTTNMGGTNIHVVFSAPPPLPQCHMNSDFFSYSKCIHIMTTTLWFFLSLFVNTARNVNLFRWQRVQHVYSLLRTKKLSHTPSPGDTWGFMLMTYSKKEEFFNRLFQVLVLSKREKRANEKKQVVKMPSRTLITKKLLTVIEKFNFPFSESNEVCRASISSRFKLDTLFPVGALIPKCAMEKVKGVTINWHINKLMF